jgi:hypothetical protein
LSKPLVLALAAFAAITMIAAGCGGGGDSTTDSSSLTKAEFLKQGNAVCAKGNKEIEEGFKDFEKENGLQNKQPTEAQLTEAIETIVLPAVRDQVDGIEALGAPSGEEEKVESITDAASEAVDEGEDDPASLTSEKADPFAKANELANEYGLVKCGEGGSPLLGGHPTTEAGPPRAPFFDCRRFISCKKFEQRLGCGLR